MPFTFHQTDLPGVVIIEPKVFSDGRGFFMEAYKKSDFAAAGIDVNFVQENHSRSVGGTLRGLHFQRAPKAQCKLVRVVQGQIFDVVVDLRPDSPTFSRWISVELSSENPRSLFVPAEYAHGFCVTGAEAYVVYHTSEEYSPDLESGVRWDDPRLAIAWPIAQPRLSERDRRWPPLSEVSGRVLPSGT
jgi:dTDP-4-dehydrorhamnose 3,5-epimerase